MSSYIAKASAGRQYKTANLIGAGIVLAVSCLGLFLCVYSFVKGNWIFGVAYLVAIILGFSYVAIKCNTVFATYLAIDKGTVYLKNWENDFLPYAIGDKKRLLSEFLPAKTRMMEVPARDIAFVMIGTKNYIKRYSNNPEFSKAVKPFETAKDYYKKRSVQIMDILYLMTYDGNFCFMPIEGFEPKQVLAVLKALKKMNPDVEIRANSKKFRLGTRRQSNPER